MLVDDHDGFRRSATRLLELDGCRVVATAGTGEEALALISAGEEAFGADVVLVDLFLPGIDGVEVAIALATRRGAPPVILISSHDEVTADVRVAAAPVLGFLPKRDLTCAAIRALLP